MGAPVFCRASFVVGAPPFGRFLFHHLRKRSKFGGLVSALGGYSARPIGQRVAAQLLRVIREARPFARKVVHGLHRRFEKLASGEQASHQFLGASLIVRLSQGNVVGDLQEFALAEHVGVSVVLKVCSTIDHGCSLCSVSSSLCHPYYLHSDVLNSSEEFRNVCSDPSILGFRKRGNCIFANGRCELLDLGLLEDDYGLRIPFWRS